jgi:hypothetical protein
MFCIRCDNQIRLAWLIGVRLTLMLLAILLSGHSWAAEWRIVKLSGDVRVHGAGNVWVKARPMQVLKPGESVWTGRRSRAQIETDEGSVILRSRSLVKVPAQTLPEGTTVLLQGQGKVEAKVEKREKRHFSIQTPFLAAVVKGTEFSVDMRSRTTSLSVREGAVGAVSVDSGQQVDVGAGQSMTTANKKGADLGKAGSGRSGSGQDQGASGGSGNDPADQESASADFSGPGNGRRRGKNGGNGQGYGYGYGRGYGHGGYGYGGGYGGSYP